MKLMRILLLFCLLLSMAAAVNAAITAIIQSPSSGWNNNYNILLNVTTNDNANITFNTTAYSTLTTLATNNTQGYLTLNSTFLNEGNNTIVVYTTNATNASDTDTKSVANVAVDVSAPTWDQIPSSHSVEYGTSYSYDVNATDLRAIIYSIDDTTNFAVNAGTGAITNATVLTIGAHSLQINATDSFNQVNSTTITVTVQDTADPTWDSAPADQSVTYNNAFSYDVDASDNVAVDDYSINDTTNFAINASGTIINNTLLAVGAYDLNISANDTSNNIVSAVITVTVNAATPPSSGGGGGSSSRECRDSRDNDGDGLIDYPDDPGCLSSYDDDETDEDCTENWYCGSWTDCIDNQQARTCEDWNVCRTTALKPAETRECTVEIIEEPVLEEDPLQPAASPITGAVVVEEGPLSAGNILIKSLAIIAISAAVALVITKTVKKK
ncbi:cadherin repeat domain-containing protein [Candidatus Woesearchaeota archaeon]|nr:cadherin repeat domain-containing protein [Candidatus Woesearchaeota archaeon]